MALSDDTKKLLTSQGFSQNSGGQYSYGNDQSDAVKKKKKTASGYAAPTYQRPDYPGMDWQTAYSQAAAQLDPAAQMLKKRTEEAYAKEKEQLPQYLNARGQVFGGARIIGENNLFKEQTDKINAIDTQNNAAVASLAQTLMDRAQARAGTMAAQDYNQWSDAADRSFRAYQVGLGQQNTDRSYNLDVQNAAQEYALAQQKAQSEAEQRLIDNQFKQMGYDLDALKTHYQGLQTEYNINKPYYNPNSSGSKPTQAEKNSVTTQKAINWVGSHWDMFNDSPANMGAQVQKNMETGKFDIAIGNAILKYLKDNYSN